MKRRITWIRHGQSEWNAIGKWQGHTDTPLSKLGKQQASKLAKRLRGLKFDAVYSSDLQRAAETGRLALPETEIRIDSRLREINFGIYEGKTRESLTQEEQKSVFGWWANPYTRKLQGGESMECLNRRVFDWMQELPTEADICVFCHGGVVRNAVWQVVGKPMAGDWSVAVDNTSLTVIEYDSERNLVSRLNDAAHLELL